MQITTLGVDLAKDVFQLHGVDEKGCRLQKTVRRGSLMKVMAKLPACLVGVEACGGAHHWPRQFRRLGHDVRMINPQYVKPYVKTQKNDYNDAEAICEAVSRPNMYFVPVKEIEYQDILAVHRVRSRLVAARTALINQIRGLLAEYGLLMPRQIGQVRRHVPTILEDAENRLSARFRASLASLNEELAEFDERVRRVITNEITRLCSSNSRCQRLAAVEGIGPITATALVAALGDVHVLRNSRQVAAWLGLGAETVLERGPNGPAWDHRTR